MADHGVIPPAPTPGPDPRPHRVVVVDDDVLLARSLKRLLDLDGRFQVVGLAASGPEAIKLVQELRPDLVLMDIRMPDIDGIRLTRRLLRATEKSGRPQVVMLTALEDDSSLIRALKAGASGYLIKDTPPAQLADRLADSLGGGAALSPRMARRLVSAVTPPRRGRTGSDEGLPPRSVAVLEALARGLSYAETAGELHIQVETVRTYVKEIYRRLGVQSKTAAVVAAIRAGIIAQPR